MIAALLRRPWRKARRGMQIAGAFLWMGYREMVAYPLGMLMTQLSTVVSPVVYYFVAKLVQSRPDVGGDYYTFVMLGTISILVVSGGLNAFALNLDNVIREGRFETLLVEPVSWHLTPFGLAAWPMVVSLGSALVTGAASIVLGADYRTSAIPLALVVLLLGIAANHAVGVIAASVKILAKRGDPVIGLYTLAAAVLSGVAFPVRLLPGPVRLLSYCLPTTYVISAVRRIVMPGGAGLSGPSALQAILLLLGFLAVVYPFALWLYGRALATGRRYGLLGGY